MTRHIDLTNQEVLRNIKSGKITLAGNLRLKIYGLLKCNSGKKMKRINRVFFKDESEAIASGFRSCKNCMKKKEKS